MTSHFKTEHDDCWDLIPWVVNGTASAADDERVRAHAMVCAACREELSFQRHVAETVMRLPAQAGDVEGGLTRLMAHVDARIDEGWKGDARLATEPRNLEPVPKRMPGWPVRWQRALAGVAALQTVVIAALIGMGGMAGNMPWTSSDRAAYRTLSSEPAARTAPMIRVVLAPTLSLGNMQALLKDTGLRIVDIHGEGTILGLSMAGDGRPGPDAIAAKVASLRLLPGVLGAEPIVHDEGQAP